MSGAGLVTAEAVVTLAESRSPTLGAGRLVCVDGPSGSGKTTLAEEIVALRPGSPLVHMDDLFPGWSGLPLVDAQLDGLLRPLARGQAGSYRRWDWHGDEWAETHVVHPAPLLVIEGVGAGSAGTADLVTVLVWVEAAYDVRMARGIARDGESFAPHWHRWAEDEAAHFTRHATRERADLVLRT